MIIYSAEISGMFSFGTEKKITKEEAEAYIKEHLEPILDCVTYISEINES